MKSWGWSKFIVTACITLWVVLACGKKDGAPLYQALPPTLRSLWNGDHSRGKSKFIATPLIRQSRNYTCGAAALQSILYFWGDEFYEGQLEKHLETNPVDGTSNEAMVAFINKLNDPSQRPGLFKEPGKDEGVASPEKATHPPAWSPYFVERFANMEYDPPKGKAGPTDCEGSVEPAGKPLTRNGMTLADLENWVQRGIPVIVLLQAWNSYTPEVYANKWDGGHYAIVSGYDEKNIYFMDPSTTGNYTFIPRDEFIKRWHDYEGPLSTATGETCGGGYFLRNFGLVIRKQIPPIFVFDKILKMD